MVRKRDNNRGQGTIEFIILFSAALFFFVVFMGIIQLNILDSSLEKQEVFVQHIVTSVRDEIGFAVESSDGYTREFFVPNDALGAQYDINITDNYIFVFLDDYSLSYKTFNISGQIQKGTNIIKKENGTVYLNT